MAAGGVGARAGRRLGRGYRVLRLDLPAHTLEHELRLRAGQAGYQGDFVARYLLPVLYPEGLTREAQVALGTAALLLNLGI